jgi:hypothetical protein
MDTPLCPICKERPRQQFDLGRLQSYCKECTAVKRKKWLAETGYARKRMKKQYIARVSEGKCPRCGQPNPESTVYCPPCTIKLHGSSIRHGAVFHNRQLIATKRDAVGEKMRRFWLTKCLTCARESWVVSTNVKRFGCPCIRRQSFCSGCGKYLTSGATQCKQCYQPPKWTIEKWVQAGRPYSARRSGPTIGRVRAKKRAAIASFLHTEQSGLCAFCSMPLGVEGSHIDHHHESDRTRGLVHPLCNHLIGVLEAALSNGAPLPSIVQIVKGFFDYFEKPLPQLGPSE